MPARNPEDIDRLFAAALNGGDLDALVALHEPQASLTPFAIDEPFGIPA